MVAENTEKKRETEKSTCSVYSLKLERITSSRITIYGTNVQEYTEITKRAWFWLPNQANLSCPRLWMWFSSTSQRPAELERSAGASKASADPAVRERIAFFVHWTLQIVVHSDPSYPDLWRDRPCIPVYLRVKSHHKRRGDYRSKSERQARCVAPSVYTGAVAARAKQEIRKVYTAWPTPCFDKSVC